MSTDPVEAAATAGPAANHNPCCSSHGVVVNEAAVTAASRVTQRGGTLLEAIDAAAPHLIASELRQWANRLEAEARRVLGCMRADQDGALLIAGGAHGALSRQALEMRDRAAELTGTTDNDIKEP